MIFWLIIFSCIIAWYLWVTFNVGRKGAQNIKQMIQDLKNQNQVDE